MSRRCTYGVGIANAGTVDHVDLVTGLVGMECGGICSPSSVGRVHYRRGLGSSRGSCYLGTCEGQMNEPSEGAEVIGWGEWHVDEDQTVPGYVSLDITEMGAEGVEKIGASFPPNVAIEIGLSLVRMGEALQDDQRVL